MHLLSVARDGKVFSALATLMLTTLITNGA